MIPDIPIYRKDDNGYEYNVFFSAETIKQIEKNYFNSIIKLINYYIALIEHILNDSLR